MKVVQQRNRSNRGCLLLENTYPISVRLKTAGHRRRPQKTTGEFYNLLKSTCLKVLTVALYS